MILPFRISLAVLGAFFAYLFGETCENFLLEVVRFFVPLEASNALLFNAVHVCVSAVPLLLFGFIISVSLSGEAGLRRRLWLFVLGLGLGLVSFRVYQIWWVFRGGIGEEVGAWTESMTLSQLYFLEKICPFLILGGISSLAVAIWENEGILIYPVLSAAGSFLWLLITHKVQNLAGPLQLGQGFLVTSLAGFAVSLAVKKIKSF